MVTTRIAVCAQEIETTFDRLTIDDGLSNNNPTSIIQDKKGFIWIGTEEGLNKYDGYAVKIYKNKISDPQSLVHNEVVCQYIDSKGNHWIGTNGGVSLYDEYLDSFLNYSFLSKKQSDISHNRVRGFFEDANNNLFIVVEYGWIYQYDQTRKKLNLFDSTNYRNINTVKIDKNDILAVGTFNGLILKHIRKNNKQTLLKDKSTDVLLDDGDFLWIGVEGGGIYQYNKIEKAVTPYVSLNTRENDVQGLIKDFHNNVWITGGVLRKFNIHENKFYFVNDHVHSLSTLETNAIFEDVQGNIWIGVYYGGVRIIRKTKNFNSIRYNPGTSQGLSHSVVSAITMNGDDELWVGYFEGGIDVFNLNNKSKTTISPGSLPSQLGEATVFFIINDSMNNIWTGTYKGGLQQYNKKTGAFKSYRNIPSDSFSIASNDVRSIIIDENSIWVAAHGKGLDKFNGESKTFFHHRTESSGNFILDKWGYQLLMDSDHNIWYASTSGLFKFSGNQYTNLDLYNSDPKNSNSLSEGTVNCIYEDSYHNLWIGTINGLNLFDKVKNSFTRLTTADGLPNNVINAICEDNRGKLWISTNKGIFSLEMKTDKLTFQIKAYDKTDGLLDNQFYPRASFVNKRTGDIYFGGISGITWFHPDSIKENTLKPNVVLTDFSLYYQSVALGEKSPLKKHISQTHEIILPYNQKIITFDFIALNFIGTQKNQYAYTMEGFDNEWHYVGHERKATYTNLDPGHYVFRVKASNNDGVWNENSTSISLIIHPPFWRTSWAYTAYALLIIACIGFFRRSIIRREKQRHAIRQEREAAKRQYEENKKRLDFFTKISHELRTPLTLIIDPIDKLKEKYQNESESNLLFKMVHRNVERLLRIVNQLMDYRKMESGFMKLELIQDDIVKYIITQANDFAFEASQKNIDFTTQSLKESYNAWFDPDKVEKIMVNILSNAVKYTPANGSISVLLKIAEDAGGNLPRLIISVKDSGVGISKEDQLKIFTMFYRADNRFSKMKNGGTGIGLALTKELIALHGGSIDIESEIGKGSTFTVHLPLNLQPSAEGEYATSKYQEPFQSNALQESEVVVFRKSNHTSVLVVEDNEEIRNYLIEELQKSYKVIEAFDGLDGFEKATETIPDLIICDIMMPALNGLELVGLLKNDIRTSHIPVIMLTARTSDEQKIEGYEIGADAYITKPFSTRVLMASIKNLLLSRKKLRELFQQNDSFKQEEVFENKVDQDFIRRINEAIANNLSNQNLNTSQFAKEVGMSRAQLYKKFKAITDQTIYDYIMKIRLEKAKEMLERTSMTIQEISFAVGFSKQSNFSRAFANQYGMPPSKIRKKL